MRSQIAQDRAGGGSARGTGNGGVDALANGAASGRQSAPTPVVADPPAESPVVVPLPTKPLPDLVGQLAADLQAMLERALVIHGRPVVKSGHGATQQVAFRGMEVAAGGVDPQ